MRVLPLCLALIFLPRNQLGAQALDHRLRPLDAVLGAGAAGLYVTPHLLDLNDHPPSCAPCDRGGVPWFDRWAIGEPRGVWSDASSGLLVAMAALGTLDLARDGASQYGEVGYLAESAGWAVGAAELIKAIAARKRPVLYTDLAPSAAGRLDAQRSLPSGHTAAAFALAAAYLLAPRQHPLPAWRRWAAVAAAASVGALRVAGAQHFPSDIVGGAALGTVTAVAVRAVRF